MTPSRYLVIQCGGAWVIRSGNRTFGPSSDHVHATDAAIGFAGKDGKAGRPRKFWCKRTEGRCEPFRLTDATRTPARHAILPMAGPTGISPAMTTPLRYRHVPIRPASPLLGHRTPIRIASIFADAVKLMPVVYARTVLDRTQAPWWSATQSTRAIIRDHHLSRN